MKDRKSRYLSRKDFLRWSALTTVSAVLTACGGGKEPEASQATIEVSPPGPVKTDPIPTSTKTPEPSLTVTHEPSPTRTSTATQEIDTCQIDTKEIFFREGITEDNRMAPVLTNEMFAEMYPEPTLLESEQDAKKLDDARENAKAEIT